MAFIEPMHRNKPNITYLLTSGKFENMSGKFQRILRETILRQSVGTLKHYGHFLQPALIQLCPPSSVVLFGEQGLANCLQWDHFLLSSIQQPQHHQHTSQTVSCSASQFQPWFPSIQRNRWWFTKRINSCCHCKIMLFKNLDVQDGIVNPPLVFCLDFIQIHWNKKMTHIHQNMSWFSLLKAVLDTTGERIILKSFQMMRPQFLWYKHQLE